MANTLYPKGAEKTLKGQINWESDTIKACIVPSSYAYDATDEFLTDLGSTIGTAQTLTNKSAALGTFNCDDLSFPAIASGATCKAIVLYKDTGSSATSPVLEYIDQITGWPLATNGGVIDVQMDNGAYKVFTLVG